MEKKKNIIKIIAFISVFTALILFATFFDYQISEFLASKDLTNGEYLSKNIFGNIFEAIGESVLYIALCFACACLSLYFFKKKKAYGYILFVLFGLIAIYPSSRIFSVFGGYVSSYSEKLSFFSSKAYSVLIIIFALLFAGLNFLYLYKKHWNRISSLLPFALIIIGSFALSQAIVQGVKPLMGRERFRAIYYFTSNNLDHNGFTRWYISNGKSSEIAALYNSPADWFKSFPSGHTCSAAITFVLLLLPKMYKDSINKGKIIFCYLFPFAWTIIVAFTRILVGAHYLSDVTIGGFVTIASVYICYFIYLAIIKKTEQTHQFINSLKG